MAGAQEIPAGPPTRAEDPILQVISRHLAESRRAALPAGGARLTLEVLELTAGHGIRRLGRFTAPADPAHPARLQRLVDLPAGARGGPVRLQLDVQIAPRPLSERRLGFSIESRVGAAPGEAADSFMRNWREDLEAGSSALFEAFRVPGTLRRLLLALSWRPLPEESQPVAGSRHPASMVDLLVELVRRGEGTEQTLRRQQLSTGLGAEVRSLMRLAGDAREQDAQELEVRLAPREVDSRGLLMAVLIRASLASSGDAPPLWLDHSDSTRLGPGQRYSVDLGSEEGGTTSYRLDIRPYF